MDGSPYFIGLMSGTSIDCIDAVLVQLEADAIRVAHHSEHPIPADVRSDILALCQPGDDHLDRLGHCDRALGELFAEAVKQLLSASNVAASQVLAIGSHGQTVRHRPPHTNEQLPFTLQIGDPNVIATRTGITTIADFRRRDMALGGQGAPLVPAFHNAAFSDSSNNRAVLNLGGIANITWLPTTGDATGFDTGPANLLMDAWCHRHLSQPYDDNGDWAASGTVQLELLKQLLAHPFLAKPAPKSTGREEFNLEWLDRVLAKLGTPLNAADVQATLLEFTARSAADAIKAQGEAAAVYLCGGGAYNGQLKKRLAALLPNSEVLTTDELGVPPKLVEATAFAWLAKRTLEQLPGNLPAVTGASQEAILGGIYLAGRA